MFKYYQKQQCKHAGSRSFQQTHVTFFVSTGTYIDQILQGDWHGIDGFCFGEFIPPPEALCSFNSIYWQKEEKENHP